MFVACRHVADKEQLVNVCKEYLSDYNAVSKKPMDLALFAFALEHISRICRIITLPGGNALLVGLGGSGRQSLTRLAAFMEDYECFQIEVSKSYGKTEWHDDLRKVLRIAGESNKPVVFLFSDTQMKNDCFIEDISNLLNTGEVPNLMASGDLAQIFENIRARAKAAGMDSSRAQLFNFFLQTVQKNLHVVLSFSYVGDAFRERLRKFPSLVNCTTIDWFTAWPQDALHAVAEQFLSNQGGVSEEDMKALASICVTFHQTAHTVSADFRQKERRNNYVTPTSYLELLLTYKSMLNEKQKEVSALRTRYMVGLEKLAATESSVEQMQIDLTALQPQLELAKVCICSAWMTALANLLEYGMSCHCRQRQMQQWRSLRWKLLRQTRSKRLSRRKRLLPVRKQPMSRPSSQTVKQILLKPCLFWNGLSKL
jgi:dynein heavy chain, axonemal